MINFSKDRLEAFSDGVIAVIITIMVLNIPLPDTFGRPEILNLLRSVLIFFISFVIVGYHWSNHHLVMTRLTEVSNRVLWKNLLFLFFLALIPIFTKWVILHSNEIVPVIGYDIVFLLVNISFFLLWSEAVQAGGGRKMPQDGRPFVSRYAWLLRWIIMLALVGAILVVSFFYPRLSLVFFMGFPVAVSLSNLLIERTENDRRQR
jgi:uncharacterized membrane protein